MVRHRLCQQGKQPGQFGIVRNQRLVAKQILGIEFFEFFEFFEFVQLFKLNQLNQGARQACGQVRRLTRFLVSSAGFHKPWGSLPCGFFV